MDFFTIFCCVKGSDRKHQGKKELTWRIFSLKELQLATNNFNYDNKLGEGGFGSVYWGQLWDGSQIAVKRLKSWSNKAEMEFSVEVETLARVRHKNLLTLRGYCAEGQERLIVYDYMINLSLLSHLHGPHSAECHLDWNRRMNIAVGAAELDVSPLPLFHFDSYGIAPTRFGECPESVGVGHVSDTTRWLWIECRCNLAAEGIAYLHHFATPHIIHRDIKASNVLLDGDFQAQVADFGFAKFIPDGATHVTTRVKGTLGYLAPEYAMLGKASESCDVYSFGILLLELASGKKPLEKLSSTIKRSITDWALPLAREGKFNQLVDFKLYGKYVEEELKRVVLTGLICSHNQPEKRPTMLEVIELLKGDREKFAALETHEIFKSSPVSEENLDDISDEKEPKQEIESV